MLAKAMANIIDTQIKLRPTPPAAHTAFWPKRQNDERVE
jgi:hypothetical protein